MLQPSPRWDRQAQAVFEAAHREQKPTFSIFYYFSMTCSAIYMVGWLNFNLWDLPAAPMSLHTMFLIGLTAVAGLCLVLALPTTLVVFGIDRRLYRQIRRLDQTVDTTSTIT